MLAQFEKRAVKISVQPRHLQRARSLASAEGTLERRYAQLLLSSSAVVIERAAVILKLPLLRGTDDSGGSSCAWRSSEGK